MTSVPIYFTAEEINDYIKSKLPEDQQKYFEDCTFVINKIYVDMYSGIEARAVPVKSLLQVEDNNKN